MFPFLLSWIVRSDCENSPPQRSQKTMRANANFKRTNNTFSLVGANRDMMQTIDYYLHCFVDGKVTCIVQK